MGYTQKSASLDPPPFLTHTDTSELIQGGIELSLSTAFLFFGHRLFDTPIPSFGVPQNQSLDVRFSRWVSPRLNPGNQWLKGIPDLMGYVVPALGGLGYGIGALLHQMEIWNSPLQPYRIWSYSKGLARALGITYLLKYTVGRARPVVARSEVDLQSVRLKKKEYFLSFPSGHSSAIVASTTFLALDLSTYLAHDFWKDEPAWKRYGLGKGLPYLGAFTVSSIVMYSRVKDQRHWLSDVLIGGGIGFLSAWLTFHFDFDEKGWLR
jgi:membrane-associated phospholipid phosphatase